MKILHVIDSAGIYGAENMLLSLMREQVKMGCEPILASIGSLLDGEKALETIDGFQWITHTVNYKNFPASLSITCVFDNPESLATAKAADKDTQLKSWIQKELAEQNILIRTINSAVSFDTEEFIH